MDALMERLAEALQEHGLHAVLGEALEGRTGTVYKIPLLIEGEKAYVVDCHLDGVVPTEAIQDMAAVVEDVGAHGGILCHLEANEPNNEPTVLLWGKDDLRRILGTAVLAHVAGVEPDPLNLQAAPANNAAPVAESLEDLLPPAFNRPTQTEEPDDEMFAGFDMDALADPEPFTADFQTDGVAPSTDSNDTFDFDGLTGLTETAPEMSPSFDALADVAPAAPQFAHQVLPVRVTPQEAMMRARERLFEADRIARILQPVHLVDYECDLIAEGSLRYDTISGRLQIHGTSKVVIEVDRESVDPAAFSKEVPEVPAEERTLRVSLDRARERSTAFLMAHHTRVVDVSIHSEEGSFDYTEKKKVSPRPDHVRLNPIGVFHRVVWRVIGPNGHVDIDALTGDAVEEQLATPDPGTVMLD